MNPMGMSTQTTQRRHLLTAVLGGHHVTTAEVREVTLEAGQQGGRHLHPCAVLGYIVHGTAVYEIEGEPAQTLLTGSAFYEPAGKVIANFGNASDTEPLIFAAFYLKDGEQELITMLPERLEGARL